MKNKILIMIAAIAVAGFAAVSLFLLFKSQNEIQSLTRQNNDMTVKLDELDVQIESMNATSRATNSAIKKYYLRRFEEIGNQVLDENMDYLLKDY